MKRQRQRDRGEKERREKGRGRANFDTVFWALSLLLFKKIRIHDYFKKIGTYFKQNKTYL